ncbi:hypothetical protein JCM8115_001523 [Rhodotorula mucilaginosa]
MKLALAAAFALEAASTVHAIAVGTIDPAKKMKRSHFENLVKRQSFTTGNASDSTVLSNALAGYYNLRPLLEQVAQDEAEHVNFFTTALKAANISAVQACNYTFPYEDVSGFLRLAQVLENVVVSAFLGAVTSVPTSPRPRSEAGAGAIDNSLYPGAPATILTVDARHSAFFNFLRRESPFPFPMDTPLSERAVVTVLKQFTESCPSGSAPKIAPFPALNFTSSEFFSDGKVFVAPVEASAVNLNATVYCGFALGLGANFSVWSNGSCDVPTQIIIDKGQTYIFLTKEQSVADESVLAGPATFSLSSQNVTVSIPNATLYT